VSRRGAQALSALLNSDGGLAAWSGLPEGLAPEDYAPVVDAPGDAPALSALGLERALVRFGELAPAGVPAELWTAPGEDGEVWAVAIDTPPFAPAPAALRELLGPPALTLDTARGTVALAQSEWVWPARGLTAYVDEADARVWRIALFPAGTADEYTKHYRADLGTRRS
jgi:hypothetical protein